MQKGKLSLRLVILRCSFGRDGHRQWSKLSRGYTNRRRYDRQIRDLSLSRSGPDSRNRRRLGVAFAYVQHSSFRGSIRVQVSTWGPPARCGPKTVVRCPNLRISFRSHLRLADKPGNTVVFTDQGDIHIKTSKPTGKCNGPRVGRRKGTDRHRNYDVTTQT